MNNTSVDWISSKDYYLNRHGNILSPIITTKPTTISMHKNTGVWFSTKAQVNNHFRNRLTKRTYHNIRPIIIRPKFQGISIDHEFPNSFPVDICGSNGSCLGCCVVNQQRGFTGAEATEVTEPGAEKKDRPQRETPGDVNVGSD